MARNLGSTRTDATAVSVVSGQHQIAAARCMNVVTRRTSNHLSGVSGLESRKSRGMSVNDCQTTGWCKKSSVRGKWWNPSQYQRTGLLPSTESPLT
jgi:hypothetical protein